jgi:hypothetical protein
MIEIDWGNAPDWANYHAFDANGNGYWYEEKPKLLKNYGLWGVTIRKVLSSNLFNNKTYFANTLTCRPGHSDAICVGS